jgi:hypothetical protein
MRLKPIYVFAAVAAVILTAAGCTSGTKATIQTPTTSSTSVAAPAATPTDPMAGTLWMVTADAPYAPHMFAFSADGLMISTNPSNVQENKKGTGEHDSLGIGYWHARPDGLYDIDFFELNSKQLRDPHTDKAVPTDTLEVRATVQLNGDKFTSTTAGVFFNNQQAAPTSVKGTLVKLTPMG